MLKNRSAIIINKPAALEKYPAVEGGINGKI